VCARQLLIDLVEQQDWAQTWPCCGLQLIAQMSANMMLHFMQGAEPVGARSCQGCCT
jgi:hypothetical protein